MQENKIYKIDALKGFQKLPNNYCDMIITSPPYYGLRDYGTKGQLGLEKTSDLYLDKLVSVFTQAKRVLKESGTLWINIGDSYGGSNMGYGQTEQGNSKQNVSKLSYYPTHSRKSVTAKVKRKSLLGIPFRFATMMIEQGWILRNTIIWQKPNAMPESVKDRFTNDFEYLFFFTKSTKYYFNQQLEPFLSNEYDQKRMKNGRKIYEGKWSKTNNRSKLNNQHSFVAGNEKGRNKRAVWQINTKSYKEAHFAVFPEELIEVPILAGSPENALIIDPFIGSGTTGVVAKKFNRNYIGFEINPDFIKIAYKRILNTDISDIKNVAGLGKTETFDKKGYIAQIQSDLKQGIKYNKTSIEKLAKSYGITNKNLVKEYTELAIVLNAREIAHDGSLTTYEKYLDIVAVYESQVNLSMRTSMSVMMQQYSTPAPISFLASTYILNNTHKYSNNKSKLAYKKSKLALYLEPSAGNGLLTIALPYSQTYVNELDDIRLENLKEQPFAHISSWDALQPPLSFQRKFDGVITNPPFGSLHQAISFANFKIKRLEHAMCLKALHCMKDTGKSALIIGGHTTWDERGRVTSGQNRIFLNYLYHFYNVDDIILINGRKLYSKQGTSFNTRLILINGAKSKPNGASPLKNKLHSTIVNSHEELWDRVGLVNANHKLRLAKAKAKAILILQNRQLDTRL